MTVSQLLNFLKDQPPEARVIIAGYEGGYNDISQIAWKTIRPDHTDVWYLGQHDDADDGEKALLLAGENMLSEEYLYRMKKKGHER